MLTRAAIIVLLVFLCLLSSCGDEGSSLNTPGSVLNNVPVDPSPSVTPTATVPSQATATPAATNTISPSVIPAATPTATSTATPSVYYRGEVKFKSPDISIQRYDVREMRIEFKNTGTVSWDPNNVHLATSNPYNRISHIRFTGDSNWMSEYRIKMQQKKPVQTGEIAEFIFYICPDFLYKSSIQGFQLVADSTCEGLPPQLFGKDGYAEVYVRVTDGLYYYAEISSKSPDISLDRYSTKEVKISFKNIGTVPWDPSIVHLGASNPNDRNTHLYTDDGKWLNDNRIRMEQTSPVQPGQTADFIFNIKPDGVCTSSIQGFELVADGTYMGVPNQWFGPDGYTEFYLTVTGAPPVTPTPRPKLYDAEFVSLDPGNVTVQRGTKRLVTVKFKNTGSATWTPDIVRLGTSNPKDRTTNLKPAIEDGYWYSGSENRIRLQQSSVAPGETGEFKFYIEPNALFTSSDQAFELVADASPGGWFGTNGYIHFYVTVTD